jgi:transcriptional regulator with XRE-family HTH domain
VSPIDPQKLITRVARRIAELRRTRGLTQAEFAERLNCSVQYVGLVERGKQNLTLGKLAEIANVLGTSFEDLVKKPKRRSLEVKMGRPIQNG